MNPFIETITSTEPEIRNRSFMRLCEVMEINTLLNNLEELNQFRLKTPSLYDGVRASMFLYQAYRFVIDKSESIPKVGKLPYQGYQHLLERRFEQAVSSFLKVAKEQGLSVSLASCLAESYHQLAFQLLADQVRKSVKSSSGNRWMFRIGHMDELPIKIHETLMIRSSDEILYPVLEEQTPVRMDLTHSAWSDIFFLGMDYPEGARVINVSVNLAVYGRDEKVKPPITTYFRVIEEPLIRLSSIDLRTTKEVYNLKDLFNFGNDYLGLLKAGIVASGIIPPAFEGSQQSLKDILSRIVGQGMGFELITKVNDIPKGSRLAVSTNLLGSIISLLMRATRQTTLITGPLEESERRLVASRAILGEWLGGSGGGWQDSGGIWPGIKIIQGTKAQKGDPEHGISRGRLLPKHQVLTAREVHPDLDKKLSRSLIILHGGMAQNVGPILEMVTEKYLLRSEKEWKARAEAGEIFDNILEALREGDIKKLAANTQRNWDHPIKTIIPWASTHFTEVFIKKTKQQLGKDYWGFLMMGGMSGGGMGVFVNPDNYDDHLDVILTVLQETKKELKDALPFAMDPVVYDFKINQNGSFAFLKRAEEALLPADYYQLWLPSMVHDAERVSPLRKSEFNLYSKQVGKVQGREVLLQTLISHLFKEPNADLGKAKKKQNKLVARIKKENGFDFLQHEQLRKDLIKGRIGLSHNRLPAQTQIEDVGPEDVLFLEKLAGAVPKGRQAIKDGKVGILSLAGGVGSRWTQGAGVIKALNPFAEFAGTHRSFLEIHLHKTQKSSELFKVEIPHIIATSHLTHAAIENELKRKKNFGFQGQVYLSPGRSIGQRFVPMERDLRFLWEEMPQETLDENKQKVQDSIRSALIKWAKTTGEGTDYVDNLAMQRFSPLGHWYEFSNLLRNGTLVSVLQDFPKLETLLLHNIDTLGVHLDAAAMGSHLESGNTLTLEVVPRKIEDKGGGLANINGAVRILEGLAQPREEDELRLSYYNSMTTWIQIDPLLKAFGLTRQQLDNPDEVDKAVREMAQRMPSYVTIKEVKYRWGHGQEDVYPIAQIEKLWSDMTGLAEVSSGFIVVPRVRGQQLKSPDQLDAWANDGSKDYVAELCGWANEKG